MQREAFKAMTAPFPRSSPRMQPRSPYVERGSFVFPGPSTTSRVPPPAQPPSALNFVPSSAVLPPAVAAPSRVSASSIAPAFSSTSSPPVVRTQTEKARGRGHAHTYSSDASAAAASLLNLSLSGGSVSSMNTSPTASNGALNDRANSERDDKDERSMFVLEMDCARERTLRRVEGPNDEEGNKVSESEGMDTAPTSVDSHVDADANQVRTPKDLNAEQDQGSSPKTSMEPNGKESLEASSVENGNMGEREPTSSAENETGEGEAEGDGDGGDGKRHTCPHCKKRFNRPSSLKIHLNTHTGAKRKRIVFMSEGSC